MSMRRSICQAGSRKTEFQWLIKHLGRRTGGSGFFNVHGIQPIGTSLVTSSNFRTAELQLVASINLAQVESGLSSANCLKHAANRLIQSGASGARRYPEKQKNQILCWSSNQRSNFSVRLTVIHTQQLKSATTRNIIGSMAGSFANSSTFAT